MDWIIVFLCGILVLMLASRPLSSNAGWIMYFVANTIYNVYHPSSFYYYWGSAFLIGSGLYGLYNLVTGYKTTKFPYPPGPTPRFLIGNLLELPRPGVLEYQHWLKHKDQYGGISSVHAFGTTIVLIHDKDVASDLLEKPGMNKVTSGRAHMTFASELCGFGNAIVCMPFGEHFKRLRKMLHGEIGTRAVANKYDKALADGLLQQLVHIYDEPGRLLDHYKNNTAASIMKLTYGYNVESPKKGTNDENDPLVSISEQMMVDFSAAAVPMKWAVDVIPALKYLPDGFPGTGFKETAALWRKRLFSTAYVPVRFVEKVMAEGRHKESYVSRKIDELSQDGKLSPEDELAIAWTSGSLFGAGADTTVITLTVFTLAMIRFPNVQQKAREEIDRVIGRDRLPTTKDRQNLPYINALVKEVLRWWPLTPLSFPHRADENIDYEYKGKSMSIPKGALIMPSVWWFFHDPSVYSKPDTFDPDRFLPPRNEPEPTAAFGFGRRACPGRFLADSNLYLNISQLLSVFTIGNAVDANGSYIGVHDIKPKPGVLSYPEKFEYSVKVRDGKAKDLLEHIKREFPGEPSNVKDLDGIWDSPGLYGELGEGM